MEVLVADDDVAVASALARALMSAGHSAEAVNDGRKAMARLQAGPVDALLTDWLMPGVDGMDLVRFARTKLPYQCGIVVHSALRQKVAELHAIQAGADAYLCKPTPTKSIIQVVTGVGAKAIKAALLGPGSSTRQKLLGTRVWSQFGEHAAGILARCISRSRLAQVPSRPLPCDATFSSSMGMVDVKANVELHVSIGCSVDSAMALARSVLHLSEVDAELASELLGELCNNLLGATHTALKDEGFSFALGIPLRGPLGCSTRPADTQTVVLESGATRLVVECLVRDASAMMVHPTGLRENMVAMDDIKNPAGALLVPAGTLLTSATVERLARHASLAEIRVAKLTR